MVRSEPHSYWEYVHFEPGPIMVLLGRNKDFHVVRTSIASQDISPNLFVTNKYNNILFGNEKNTLNNFIYSLRYILSLGIDIYPNHEE